MNGCGEGRPDIPRVLKRALHPSYTIISTSPSNNCEFHTGTRPRVVTKDVINISGNLALEADLIVILSERVVFLVSLPVAQCRLSSDPGRGPCLVLLPKCSGGGDGTAAPFWLRGIASLELTVLWKESS